MPAPALRRDDVGIYWDWGWNPTGGWNIYQSFDGGVTFQVEEEAFTAAARSYAPADNTLPTFIVGMNADGSEATGRSGVVTPERPSVPSVPVDPKLSQRLRFVTCLALGAIAFEDLVSLNAPYLAVNGSWDGPLTEGEWPTPTFVWFRVPTLRGTVVLSCRAEKRPTFSHPSACMPSQSTKGILNRAIHSQRVVSDRKDS